MTTKTTYRGCSYVTGNNEIDLTGPEHAHLSAAELRKVAYARMCSDVLNLNHDDPRKHARHLVIRACRTEER